MPLNTKHRFFKGTYLTKIVKCPYVYHSSARKTKKIRLRPGHNGHYCPKGGPFDFFGGLCFLCKKFVQQIMENK